jgi:hypothetical protein
MSNVIVRYGWPSPCVGKESCLKKTHLTGGSGSHQQMVTSLLCSSAIGIMVEVTGRAAHERSTVSCMTGGRSSPEEAARDLTRTSS